jgi:hypothetical protein
VTQFFYTQISLIFRPHSRFRKTGGSLIRPYQRKHEVIAMPLTSTGFYDKIINPSLVYNAFHGARTFGKFKVIVRLAQPDHYPPYMKMIGMHSPGHYEACIPCDQIYRLTADSNVLSVELQAHVM